MSKKNIMLNCKFSQKNWEYLQKEADRMEISVSAVLRQIINHVFEKRHYLQAMIVDNAVDTKNIKNTSLTISQANLEKLNIIIFERNNNQYCSSNYYANYIISAYIMLVEANIIKMR